MTTQHKIDVRYQASAAWDKQRAEKVERCQRCGTCYPDKHLERANIVGGVCGECRGGRDD